MLKLNSQFNTDQGWKYNPLNNIYNDMVVYKHVLNACFFLNITGCIPFAPLQITVDL